MTAAVPALPVSHVARPGGHSVLGPELVALVSALDARFCGWARALGAREYVFPPVIAATALERVGYFKAFPHLATFAVSLERGTANLRAFAQQATCDRDGALRLPALEPALEVLTPAACYHVYDLLAGQALAAPLVVTTRATCFRRESHYVPLQRQHSFQMREIVCLGPAEEVESFVRVLQARILAFLQEAGLEVLLERATDPFFDPEHSPGYVMQKLLPLKTEVVWEGLALGSLNRHGQHFGRVFDIQGAGEPVHSACVAFGLERWLHALVSRHGVSRAGWPRWITEAVHE